ncbi:MAG: hypothetical protein JJ863_14285 [Deltaproteobacteria bacterium]|nr:hypothetical protein [Deltaproteobacteria bacterium]
MTVTKRRKREKREVPIAWEALEDAFENNAPEVHSYLQFDTGEVIRIVDGVADPRMHEKIARDDKYLKIDPVSSREQYRWMERFIDSVEDEKELQTKLTVAIDGKGAFRRFKDVLMSYPVQRERWFTFRSERLAACMKAWLTAHDIEAVERPAWRVPSAEEVRAQVEPTKSKRRLTRAQTAEANRLRLKELVDLVPVRELDTALAFMEFLKERRRPPRTRAKGTDDESGDEASDESGDETESESNEDEES